MAVVQESGIEVQREDHENPLLVKFFYVKANGIKRSARNVEQSSVKGSTELRASAKRALTDVVASAVGNDATGQQLDEVKSENEQHIDLLNLKTKLRPTFALR